MSAKATILLMRALLVVNLLLIVGTTQAVAGIGGNWKRIAEKVAASAEKASAQISSPISKAPSPEVVRSEVSINELKEAIASSKELISAAQKEAGSEAALTAAKAELALTSEAAQALATLAEERRVFGEVQKQEADKQKKIADELGVREKRLLDQKKEQDQTERLLKTGIFGCVATCVVGIFTVTFNTVVNRVDRRHRLLETIRLEKELLQEGVALDKLPNYKPLYCDLTPKKSASSVVGDWV
jgi:hypothetical protein